MNNSQRMREHLCKNETKFITWEENVITLLKHYIICIKLIRGFDQWTRSSIQNNKKVYYLCSLNSNAVRMHDDRYITATLLLTSLWACWPRYRSVSKMEDNRQYREISSGLYVHIFTETDKDSMRNIIIHANVKISAQTLETAIASYPAWQCISDGGCHCLSCMLPYPNSGLWIYYI